MLLVVSFNSYVCLLTHNFHGRRCCTTSNSKNHPYIFNATLVVCLLVCCLLLFCFHTSCVRVCVCVYSFFSFHSIMQHRSGFDYRVSKYPVSIAFSSRVSSRWIKVVLYGTEVTLFINSTFHGNCQLENEREREKIKFMFPLALKLVSTACDTERTMKKKKTI